MIKKISRYTLQQIFIESLEDSDSFKIIDGLNPFHIMLNGKELYIYIKNLSPAYFTNPDVWRVQLPKKDEFEVIKESDIDFVLLGYDADNGVYTTWHPKWTKQRLNIGESVSFYSRLSLQEEAASTQDIKRLSLNNEGEVIAFHREHLEFLLSNLKNFFQDDSDYVAMGSKRRPEANEAYKVFCDIKNVEALARYLAEDGYSGVTIGNYCRAIRTLINDGYITRYRKVFLSCNSINEYTDVVSEFCNQPDIKEQNEKWHNTLSAALRAYIGVLIKLSENNNPPEIQPNEGMNYWDIISNQDISDSFGTFLHSKEYSPTTVGHYQNALRILRDAGWLLKYKALFDGCTSIDALKTIIKKFFAIPEIDEFNKARHHDLSAMSKQLVEYINSLSIHTEALSKVEYPPVEVEETPSSNAVCDVSTEDVDWEAMFTDAEGKLTKIANPILLDKLKPHLDSEYVNPVCAYSEVEDFYGDRYSMMSMGDWMKLFKAIDWANPYTVLVSHSENISTEKGKSKTEILRVEYPEGTVIQHTKAIDTFVEVIENSYPDLIHELNILHAGVNLVTKDKDSRYFSVQKEIAGGWLVFTNINTRKKRADLLKISDELELDLKVDVVSKSTGDIIEIDDEQSSSTRQKIKVIFPNGRTIQPNKVLEALVEVVKFAGPERVHNLDITVCADNLVLKNPKPRYEKACKPVGDGWLVNTCSDTPTKYEQIKQISDSLNLNLIVTIISGESKSTGYACYNAGDNINSIVSDSVGEYTTDSITSPLSIKEAFQWIENMRTYRINGVSSPHKPVYLLCIIKLISEGAINNRIYLNDLLIDTFRTVWNKVVPSPNSFAIDICNPYIHMASEPFYTLKMKRKDISYLDVKKSVSAIQEACEYAEIDSRFVGLIKVSKNILYNHICKKYGLYDFE